MPYRHLTEHERQDIATLETLGFSDAEIARQLKRSRSTISRERSRNTCRDGQYRREMADMRARARRKVSARNTKFRGEFWEVVIFLIQHKWSPEQVQGFLAITGMLNISHKTIYRYIKRDRRRGGTLFKNLRGSRKRHRKPYGSCDHRGHLPDRRMIDERPTTINQRLRLGDWEGDTMVGPIGTSHCILTLVERKTRFVIIKKLRSRTAAEVNRALLEVFRDTPEWFKSLTVDNGTEFHGLREIERALGATIYYCNPHQSWERGTNENMNGLIRQYIPKKVSMHPITQAYCDSICTALNSRPRKRLLFRSPAQIFSSLAA
jgi:IS30 family transposase